MPDFIQLIRQAIARNDYIITHHARQRKGVRGVRHEEIREVILHGEVIEQNPLAMPHPKCLFMFPIRSDQPLYVACGWNGQQAIIITVHWFDPEKWLDWRTRKE